MALKDTKLWPQLWEMNEHIVNPHWIYPNDKILIRKIVKITEAVPPPDVVEPIVGNPVVASPAEPDLPIIVPKAPVAPSVAAPSV